MTPRAGDTCPRPCLPPSSWQCRLRPPRCSPCLLPTPQPCLLFPLLLRPQAGEDPRDTYWADFQEHILVTAPGHHPVVLSGRLLHAEPSAELEWVTGRPVTAKACTLPHVSFIKGSVQWNTPDRGQKTSVLALLFSSQDIISGLVSHLVSDRQDCLRITRNDLSERPFYWN